MSRARFVVAIVAIALPVSACGGGSDSPRQETAAHPSPTVTAKANANCRDFFHEIKQIAKGALKNPPATVLELTTERLVGPSIPVLERTADRQQALEAKARNSQFDIYAELFDPIVVLAQQRLAAGRRGDYIGSRGLESMLTDLALEQRALAHRLGLSDCDLDFPSILLSSLTE